MKTYKTRKTLKTRNTEAVKSKAAKELSEMIISQGQTFGWINRALKLVLTIKDGVEPEEIYFRIEEERA